MSKKSNILIVGGNFANDGSSRPSGLISKISLAITNLGYEQTTVCNGGTLEDLAAIYEATPNYDLVFWFPNVSNDEPKIRNVKEIAPKTILVMSKRNNDQYSFNELIQRALSQKANLMFEFRKLKPAVTPALNCKPTYNILVFDPLGCVWSNTTDVNEAVRSAMERLEYLMNVTRKPSIFTEGAVTIPDEQEFVDIVRQYAVEFQKYMPADCKTERFIGNASFAAAPSKGRCGKGFPSFRDKDTNMIYVSKRNIDKQFIELKNFVPCYLESGELHYYGNEKPSVDTPVQIRLYNELPNIRYMIHSHCYLKNAVFTSYAIPCGAIEEVDEVLMAIDEKCGGRDKTKYCINLRGHGSIVMAGSLDELKNNEYMGRHLPEKGTMY